MLSYVNRLVDQELREMLARSGAVVIEGPKACGKTLTARQLAHSEVRVDADPTVRTLLSTSPAIVLEGPTPRLFDEWQVVPTLWNVIRHAVDDRQSTGQFILTGSAMPADDATRHSGAGRFSRLRMRPLTSLESGLSNGSVSIQHLATGSVTLALPPTEHSLTDIVDVICVGGWPANLGKPKDQAIRSVHEYVDEITRIDIATYETGQKPRDPERIAAVIRSIARGIGSAIKTTTITKDVNGTEGIHGTVVSQKTVSTYLEATSKVMILEHLPAWRTHLRSRAILRNSPKLYFADPSIAVAALRATPKGLLTDTALLGQLFENLVIRDLLVYAQHIDATVSFYRDSNGLEVDAVVEHTDGAWQAFEVKLSMEAVDAAAATLLNFAATVDTSKRGEPKALTVITSVGYAYTRPDGVHVVPITMLGA
ncbi:MAG: ATP-binding protein [Bradyrhizobiaceae bacterium]|nr:ATP-binding protein [Bradyrhizobiaceae bacterium]